MKSNHSTRRLHVPHAPGIVTHIALFLGVAAWLLLGKGVLPTFAHAPQSPTQSYVVNSLNDADDGVCDAAHCSLREAMNAAIASGADDAITFSVAGTISLGSTLPTVNGGGQLTIDGGNQITISGDSDGNGNGDVRAFLLETSGDLVLKNLTVSSGYANLSGGGLRQTGGTLSVVNVTFSDNLADENGGGLVITGGVAHLENSQFTNNQANAPNGGGGGVYQDGGSLTIINVTFSNNDAGRGAGVHVVKGSASIQDSAFSDNVASVHGGGVFIGINADQDISITNTTFTTNSAVDQGGAIRYESDNMTLTITGSEFTGNSADDGGGVSHNGNKVVIQSTTFTDNVSNGTGGGLFTSGISEITGGMFSGNSANNGGGIYVSSSSTTIISTTLSANQATNAGGGLYHSTGSVTIEKSALTDNRADRGGGFYTTNTTASTTVVNSTLASNSAINEGGAFYVQYGDVTLTNSTLADNSASAGGGFYNHNQSKGVTLTNTILDNVNEDNCNRKDPINGGYNIDSGSTCNWGSNNGSMSNTDPLLDAPTGSPLYYPLQSGSPAIDAGDDATCADPPVNNESQNGVTRPLDGDGDGTAQCDIGSYEHALPTAITLAGMSVDGGLNADALIALVMIFTALFSLSFWLHYGQTL